MEREVRLPEEGLAEEEALLGQVARGEAPPTIRVWRNARCVVVGRSQSPEEEADVVNCRALGIPVLRRCSGGGAVYHHPGNLNFSLFLPLERRWMAVRRSQSLLGQRLASALRQRWGLPAGHRDGAVFVGGYKVSGSAQLRRRAFLHHGTLVLWEDEVDMRDLLLAMQPGYLPSAVASRAAPVAALSCLSGGQVDLEEGIDLLLEAYADLDGPSCSQVAATGQAAAALGCAQNLHGPGSY